MTSTTAFARIAAMLGDPTRANMLIALMDGRALTASELAHAAHVAPQTASGHLAQLVDAGLVTCLRQGRHRYHRLSSTSVAQMLESVMTVASSARSEAPVASDAVRVGPREAALRTARTCYDHLAGRLAVAITDTLVTRAQIDLSVDGGAVTDDGLTFLRSFGLPLDRPPHGRRGRVFCRPCLDWSERRLHVAGHLGAAICARCLELGWVRSMQDTRALAITPEGRRGLRTAFGPGIDQALAA
jgi:DNA-binding transcriptional ArsR family regulator